MAFWDKRRVGVFITPVIALVHNKNIYILVKIMKRYNFVSSPEPK